MTDDFNPAQRLHDLLSAGPTEKTDQIKAIAVFSNILDVPESNGSLLLTRIADMLALPDAIKERVEAINEVNHDLYLSWHGRAAEGVRELNLRGNWRSFISYFPAASLTSIKFCSDLLSKNFPEKLVDAKDVEDLASRIDDIIHDLDSFDLPSADYFFVLHQLKTLRDSLLAYRVTGLSGIEDAYEQAIGALATHPEVNLRLRDHPVWKKTLNAILIAGWIVSTYGGASQLTHDIARLMNTNENAYESHPALDEPAGLIAVSNKGIEASGSGDDQRS